MHRSNAATIEASRKLRSLEPANMQKVISHSIRKTYDIITILLGQNMMGNLHYTYHDKTVSFPH